MFGAFVHCVILCLPALCFLVKVLCRVFLTLPVQTVKERENLSTFRSGEMGYGDRLSHETKGNGRAGGPALLGAWEEAVSYLDADGKFRPGIQPSRRSLSPWLLLLHPAGTLHLMADLAMAWLTPVFAPFLTITGFPPPSLWPLNLLSKPSLS